MAKPNYQYEKRQRELEKKRKKEEKALKKSSGDKDGGDDAAPSVDEDAPDAAGEDGAAA